MQLPGLNMTQIKKQNRGAILRYINQEGKVSRKDIAYHTGLTSSAVTQICFELMEEGLIQETGELVGSGAGRKKVLVEINWNFRYILAINIEPDYYTIALTNLGGELITQKKGQTDSKKDPEDFLLEIAGQCKTLMKNNPAVSKKIYCASVGISGRVDKEKGYSKHAYGIWKNPVDVCGILQKELELPVCIENNVVAFSKAELIFGNHPKAENMLVLKWGPGVGSSIIIGGNILENKNGRPAEIGHTIIDEGGKLCNCGRRGCLETMVSQKAMSEMGISCDLEKYSKTLKNLDDATKAKIDEMMDLFARGVVNSATVVVPEKIILCGPLFADANVRNSFISHCKIYDSDYDESKICPSAIAEKIDYIGPVGNVVYNNFFY